MTIPALELFLHGLKQQLCEIKDPDLQEVYEHFIEEVHRVIEMTELTQTGDSV